MKYSLSWTEPAEKMLCKLPDSIAHRIYNKVEAIADNPYRTGEKCEGYPFYHQRIGRYRAILEIDDSALLVTVHKVGLRKKVYDR
ncbi:MAG: type II toxin-antitoxin system RelE/ParE family toxin [Methanoregula sp.]|jgi:mRNA-degrading endonuclease RelE of RelBE toxin-antitoxin system